MAKKKRIEYFWEGTMNTSAEFTSELARRLGISPEEAQRIIKEFVSIIRKLTLNNASLAIRRLGTFQIRQRKRSKYLNKATGLMETLPIMKVIRFKPAQSWRNEVNAEIKKALQRKSDENKKLMKDSTDGSP